MRLDIKAHSLLGVDDLKGLITQMDGATSYLIVEQILRLVSLFTQSKST